MDLVAVNYETHAWRETGRNQEREERLGPRRKNGSRAKHHPAQNENEKDLIRELGFGV
ncbi:MAG: hypothetical protein ACLQU1_43070 [Bryobacteraceae bacterium]